MKICGFCWEDEIAHEAVPSKLPVMPLVTINEPVTFALPNRLVEPLTSSVYAALVTPTPKLPLTITSSAKLEVLRAIKPLRATNSLDIDAYRRKNVRPCRYGMTLITICKLLGVHVSCFNIHKKPTEYILNILHQ